MYPSALMQSSALSSPDLGTRIAAVVNEKVLDKNTASAEVSNVGEFAESTSS